MPGPSDMISIKMPDGKTYDFRRDTPARDIRELAAQMQMEADRRAELVRKGYENDKAATIEGWERKYRRNQKHIASDPPSGAENMLQGLTYNHADNALRAVGATDMADRVEQRQQAFNEQHPVGGAAYEMLGNVATSALVPGAIAAQAPRAAAAVSRLPVAVQGAGMGGATSTLSAAGRENEWNADVAKEGLVGLGAGAAIAGAGQLVNRGRQAWSNMRANSAASEVNQSIPARDPAQLMGRAGEIFDDLEQAGVVISPSKANDLRRRLNNALSRTRYRKVADSIRKELGLDLKPAAVAKLGGIGGSGRLTLNDLREVDIALGKRAHGGGSHNLDANEQSALRRLDNIISEFTEGLDETFLAGRNRLPNVGATLSEGKELYRSGKKSAQLARYFEAAEIKAQNYSQGGKMLALRNEMKSLLTRITPRKTDGAVLDKGWRKDEIEAVRQLAQMEDVKGLVKWLQRLAPTGQLSRMVWGALMLSPGNLGLEVMGLGAAMGANRAANKQAGAAAGNLMKKIAGTELSPVRPRYTQTPVLPQELQTGIAGGVPPQLIEALMGRR